MAHRPAGHLDERELPYRHDAGAADDRWALGNAPLTLPDGMLAYMQRTTVKLQDERDARLHHEAQRRGVTLSELTRQRSPCRAPPQRAVFNYAGSADEHHPGRRPRRAAMVAAALVAGAETTALTNPSSGWIRTPRYHSGDHWRVRAV